MSINELIIYRWLRRYVNKSTDAGYIDNSMNKWIDKREAKGKPPNCLYMV